MKNTPLKLIGNTLNLIAGYTGYPSESDLKPKSHDISFATGYPSESDLKPKSREISFAQSLLIRYQILLLLPCSGHNFKMIGLRSKSMKGTQLQYIYIYLMMLYHLAYTIIRNYVSSVLYSQLRQGLYMKYHLYGYHTMRIPVPHTENGF